MKKHATISKSGALPRLFRAIFNHKKDDFVKKKSASRAAFFNPRALIGFVLCSMGVLLGLFGLSNSVTVATRADTPVPRAVSPKIDVGRRAITIDEGISLRFPETWAVSGSKYRNAVELITKGAKGTESAPEARTLIAVERRLNHDEAVDRLAEIASAHSGTLTYLSIGGWPAMQLRYREPLPEVERPGQPDDLRRESVSVEERMALHTLTAIAVQETVVRLDTTVAPKADEMLARQAEDIARKTILPARSNPKDTSDEVQRLRALKSPAVRKPTPPPNGSAVPHTSALGAQPRMGGTGASALPAVFVGGSSETGAGVSTNGLGMIVVSNLAATSISTNGGVTFKSTPAAAAFPFPNIGDPFAAVGRSGNFYVVNIGLPGGATAPTGCSDSVIFSSDGGATFAFAGNAALCPATGGAMCLPDQPHIAADRFNASFGGGDQVYAVWRNFALVGGIGGPANCRGITWGVMHPSLSCSTDSGASWSAPVAIGGDDFPRVTVGQDGFVYVVMRYGRDVLLYKYTSCNSGLVALQGFPKKVISWIDDPTCPLPGLDRCHWSLTAPTVAVDDTNPSHVYVTTTKSTSANDDILVIDSVDNGLTWRTPITVNTSVSARRFMPWICTAAGNAYVGWYDRRAAAATGAASNDLTDFFLGSATMRNGQLVPDGELNLTGTSDPQCASGWPTPPRDYRDSESCTVQPQLAGTCLKNIIGGGSGTPCDFSSGPCPFGEGCWTGGGGPKYGDYNGIACGPDRVLATWASATAPVGVPSTTGIQVFADVETVNGNLTVAVKSIPANDPGRFNVLIDGNVASSSISNAQVGPTVLPVTSRHQITVLPAAGTSSSDYSVSFSRDCDSDGTVHFSALHPAVCEITNTNQCVNRCNDDEKECMSRANDDTIPPTERVAARNKCTKEKLQCIQNCSRKPTLTVVKRIVPSIDAGKFDLKIDGVVRKAGAGNGDSTPALALAPAVVHSVSESAVGGTSLSNYTTTFGGACSQTGQVSLNTGDQKTCIIVNTRKLGTGADAKLTVKKILVPANDPGRFNLLIDNVARTLNVGNGGTTGAVTLLEGTHTVSDSGVNTNLSGYIRKSSGDCDAGGGVTLMPGDNKTCTITNEKKPTAPPCPPGKKCCEWDPDGTRCTLCVDSSADCPHPR